MDLFVCGEALWISCGTWLQFWSGTIGALFAALLAAGVALVVVWLTNKHQGTLAAAAMLAQTVHAENALAAQEKALNLQLKEQQKEAAKARVYTAISDLVAAVELALAKYGESDVADDSFVAMRSAAARLALDVDSQALKNELRSWTRLMWLLQKEARIDSLRASEGRPTFDEKYAASNRLTKATASLTHNIVLWPAASDERKSVILDRLGSNRREFAKQSAAMRAKIMAHKTRT